MKTYLVFIKFNDGMRQYSVKVDNIEIWLEKHNTINNRSNKLKLSTVALPKDFLGGGLFEALELCTFDDKSLATWVMDTDSDLTPLVKLP